MSGQRVNLTLASLGNESYAVCRHTLKNALQDVVGVLIASTLEDRTSELVHDKNLFVHHDAFDGFLNHTAAVGLQRELKNVTCSKSFSVKITTNIWARGSKPSRAWTRSSFCLWSLISKAF